MKQSRLLTLCEEIATLNQRVKDLTEDLVEATSSLNELITQVEPPDQEFFTLSLPPSEGEGQGGRGPDLKERQERQAKHPPASFTSRTRPSRWRSDEEAQAGLIIEFLYHTPQYNTIAVRLGVGQTSGWIVPRSGKRFKGVWLTKSEHAVVLAETKGGE